MLELVPTLSGLSSAIILYSDKKVTINPILGFISSLVPNMLDYILNTLVSKYQWAKDNKTKITSIFQGLELATSIYRVGVYSKYSNVVNNNLLWPIINFNLSTLKTLIACELFMHTIMNIGNIYVYYYRERIVNYLNDNVLTILTNFNNQISAIKNLSHIKLLSIEQLEAVAPLKCAGLKNNTNDDLYVEETCSICLNDFSIKELHRSLPCRHTFHVDCCDTWVLKHNACPICRDIIYKK